MAPALRDRFRDRRPNHFQQPYDSSHDPPPYHFLSSTTSMAGIPSFTDSWVLASIVLSHGPQGCDLKGIIGAGDYLNHAILMHSELLPVFSKLRAADCLEERDARFVLTGMAEEWMKALP